MVREKVMVYSSNKDHRDRGFERTGEGVEGEIRGKECQEEGYRKARREGVPASRAIYMLRIFCYFG